MSWILRGASDSKTQSRKEGEQSRHEEPRRQSHRDGRKSVVWGKEEVWRGGLPESSLEREPGARLGRVLNGKLPSVHFNLEAAGSWRRFWIKNHHRSCSHRHAHHPFPLNWSYLHPFYQTCDVINTKSSRVKNFPHDPSTFSKIHYLR